MTKQEVTEALRKMIQRELFDESREYVKDLGAHGHTDWGGSRGVLYLDGQLFVWLDSDHDRIVAVTSDHTEHECESLEHAEVLLFEFAVQEGLL